MGNGNQIRILVFEGSPSVCIITYSYTHNSQSVFHETILLPQMQKSHHRSIITGDSRTPTILSVSIESSAVDDSLRPDREGEE